VLYGLYAIRDLGIGPALLGVLIGLGGISSLIGALVVKPLTQRFGIGPTMIGSIMLMGILGPLTPLAGGPVLVAAIMMGIPQLFGDAAWTIHEINEVTLRQAIAPDRLLGRVNASTHFLVGGIYPIGALVGGALAEQIGARDTLWIAVAGMIPALLFLVVSPVPRMREQPAQLA
jgi:predicted MFS family arabinose efflux permease